MKIKLTVLFLAVAAIGFAQKKELKKVEKAVGKGKIADARSLFNEIDESSVEEDYRLKYDYYDAVLKIGNTASIKADEKDLMAAIETLNEVESKGYDDDQLGVYKQAAVNAVFKKAQDKLAADDKAGALEIVNYLLTQSPDNDRMRFNAANLAYQVQDFDGAKANYLVLFDKSYTGVTESIVATDVASGQTTRFPSKKSADLAVLSGSYKDVRMEKTPSDAGSIVTNLIWLTRNTEDLDAAKALFTQAESKYGNDDSFKIAKADIYLTLDMQDEYEAAVKNLSKEITDPTVFKNLAVAAASKENWDQAIDYYKKSIAIEPNDFFTQNNLATAYINKGNLETTTVDEQTELYTNATVHLEKVLELKPDLDSAKGTLISLYNALGMTEKAEKLK
ncbi:tetratricopeptide repeat protein [Nonlabens ponticola]|uniref:Uncharacterized protein n=1 Tax=Nonlabens ponticola TaxID=2496866 RepID=A0A3S9MZP5_9FLAO|nr:tetratricopeptide repeat protein [Nonlabens ponticola]AZQ44637.1 hypothetical protein EJ995_10450 [Nonlabens ponticola]